MSDPTTTPTPTEPQDVRGEAFGVEPRKPYPAHLYPEGCPCSACLGRAGTGWKMNLCPTCGNKRCPAAADHTRWACSGSNEPGQTPAPLAAVSAAAPDEREALDVERLPERFRFSRKVYGDVADDATRVLLALTDGGHGDQPSDYLRWVSITAAQALAARPAPTVNEADVEITTAAELDALPAGTIVRDRFGGYLAQGRDAMGVAWFHYPVYDHAGSSALVAGIGPVTVCFTPGLTVADERSRQPWRHDGHKPVQHRDGKAPWCDECGWSSPAGPFPAALLGEPRSTVADEGRA